MAESEEQMTDEEVAKRCSELGGGIFSKGQYEYLIGGGGELTSSAIRQRRHKIRNNLQNAVFDLHALTDIDDKDVAKSLAPIVNLVNREVTTDQRTKVGSGIRYDDKADIEDSNIDKEDLKKGFLMLHGVKKFCSMIAAHFGDELLLAMVELALKEKRRSADGKMPEVEVCANVSGHRIEPPEDGGKSIDLLEKMESLE